VSRARLGLKQPPAINHPSVTGEREGEREKEWSRTYSAEALPEKAQLEKAKKDIVVRFVVRHGEGVSSFPSRVGIRRAST